MCVYSVYVTGGHVNTGVYYLCMCRMFCMIFGLINSVNCLMKQCIFIPGRYLLDRDFWISRRCKVSQIEYL